jgi:hypothetical protein
MRDYFPPPHMKKKASHKKFKEKARKMGEALSLVGLDNFR